MRTDDGRCETPTTIQAFRNAAASRELHYSGIAAVLNQPLPVQQQERAIRPKITASSYARVLSAKPLWKMANQYLDKAKRFSKPRADLTSLHRPVSGNMSRFLRGDIRQNIVAHIFMQLCTVIPKQAHVFGRDQGIASGGPYLVCSKTIFQPPQSKRHHAETHVKGFCQLSKTYETCGQAFHCFFVEGLLPVIFVRNKGGASVGTADMSTAVEEFNEVVKVRGHLLCPATSSPTC